MNVSEVESFARKMSNIVITKEEIKALISNENEVTFVRQPNQPANMISPVCFQQGSVLCIICLDNTDRLDLSQLVEFLGFNAANFLLIANDDLLAVYMAAAVTTINNSPQSEYSLLNADDFKTSPIVIPEDIIIELDPPPGQD